MVERNILWTNVPSHQVIGFAERDDRSVTHAYTSFSGIKVCFSHWHIDDTHMWGVRWDAECDGKLYGNFLKVECRDKRKLKDDYLKEATELLYDSAKAVMENV